MTVPVAGGSRLSTEALRRGYGAFPSGIVVLAGLGTDGPRGMAVSSFVPVSLAPPLVSVCVQLTSTTWPALRALPRIGLSVLADHQGDISTRFAARSRDRFAGVSWQLVNDGTVLIEDAAAWFSCSVVEDVRAGDHDIVVLRVHDLVAHDDEPLVFHKSRYRRLQ